MNLYLIITGSAGLVNLSVPKRRRLPSRLFIPAGEGGLGQDSVALCHQLRVVDTGRLESYVGTLPEARIEKLDQPVRITTAR